jgi:nicotinamide-nucleotide amidase
MTPTQALGDLLTQKAWMLATAESCTGGLISADCTSLAGSSLWFDRGFVTYSNAAKTELLGVPADLIARCGAVSREVALAMASGAVQRSNAHVSVAVTGVAGPGGGSAEKPVGTVWLAWQVGGVAQAEVHLFAGNRSAVRDACVQLALRGLHQRLLAAH